MRDLVKSTLISATILVIAGCQGYAHNDAMPPPAAPPPSDAVPIMLIEKVDLLVMESYPEKYVIVSDGITRNGGWTSPTLVPRHGGSLTAGGIYEADFYAVPPNGPAVAMLAPISARLDIGTPPNNLRGVRVFAETDSKELILE